MWLNLMWPDLIRHITCLKNLWVTFYLQCNFWKTDASIYKMPYLSREELTHGFLLCIFTEAKLHFQRRKQFIFFLRTNWKMEMCWSSSIILHITLKKKGCYWNSGSHWIHFHLQCLAYNPLWTIFLSPTVNANRILAPS